MRSEGEARLSTNRIAERAGVPIGSLYQYFPNKEAILVALAERERQALTTRVGNELRRAPLPVARCPLEALESAARVVLRTLIDTVVGRRKARKTILLNLLRQQEAGRMSI